MSGASYAMRKYEYEASFGSIPAIYGTLVRAAAAVAAVGGHVDVSIASNGPFPIRATVTAPPGSPGAFGMRASGVVAGNTVVRAAASPVAASGTHARVAGATAASPVRPTTWASGATTGAGGPASAVGRARAGQQGQQGPGGGSNGGGPGFGNGGPGNGAGPGGGGGGGGMPQGGGLMAAVGIAGLRPVDPVWLHDGDVLLRVEVSAFRVLPMSSYSPQVAPSAAGLVLANNSAANATAAPPTSAPSAANGTSAAYASHANASTTDGAAPEVDLPSALSGGDGTPLGGWAPSYATFPAVPMVAAWNGTDSSGIWGTNTDTAESDEWNATSVPLVDSTVCVGVAELAFNVSSFTHIITGGLRGPWSPDVTGFASSPRALCINVTSAAARVTGVQPAVPMNLTRNNAHNALCVNLSAAAGLPLSPTARLAAESTGAYWTSAVCANLAGGALSVTGYFHAVAGRILVNASGPDATVPGFVRDLLAAPLARPDAPPPVASPVAENARVPPTPAEPRGVAPPIAVVPRVAPDVGADVGTLGADRPAVPAAPRNEVSGGGGAGGATGTSYTPPITIEPLKTVPFAGPPAGGGHPVSTRPDLTIPELPATADGLMPMGRGIPPPDHLVTFANGMAPFPQVPATAGALGVVPSSLVGDPFHGPPEERAELHPDVSQASVVSKLPNMFDPFDDDKGAKGPSEAPPAEAGPATRLITILAGIVGGSAGCCVVVLVAYKVVTGPRKRSRAGSLAAGAAPPAAGGEEVWDDKDDSIAAGWVADALRPRAKRRPPPSGFNVPEVGHGADDFDMHTAGHGSSNNNNHSSGSIESPNYLSGTSGSSHSSRRHASAGGCTDRVVAQREHFRAVPITAAAVDESDEPDAAGAAARGSTAPIPRWGGPRAHPSADSLTLLPTGLDPEGDALADGLGGDAFPPSPTMWDCERAATPRGSADPGCVTIALSPAAHVAHMSTTPDVGDVAGYSPLGGLTDAQHGGAFGGGRGVSGASGASGVYGGRGMGGVSWGRDAPWAAAAAVTLPPLATNLGSVASADAIDASVDDAVDAWGAVVAQRTVPEACISGPLRRVDSGLSIGADGADGLVIGDVSITSVGMHGGGDDGLPPVLPANGSSDATPPSGTVSPHPSTDQSTAPSARVTGTAGVLPDASLPQPSGLSALAAYRILRDGAPVGASSTAAGSASSSATVSGSGVRAAPVPVSGYHQRTSPAATPRSGPGRTPRGVPRGVASSVGGSSRATPRDTPRGLSTGAPAPQRAGSSSTLHDDGAGSPSSSSHSPRGELPPLPGALGAARGGVPLSLAAMSAHAAHALGAYAAPLAMSFAGHPPIGDDAAAIPPAAPASRVSSTAASRPPSLPTSSPEPAEDRAALPPTYPAPAPSPAPYPTTISVAPAPLRGTPPPAAGAAHAAAHVPPLWAAPMGGMRPPLPPTAAVDGAAAPPGGPAAVPFVFHPQSTQAGGQHDTLRIPHATRPAAGAALAFAGQYPTAASGAPPLALHPTAHTAGAYQHLGALAYAAVMGPTVPPAPASVTARSDVSGSLRSAATLAATSAAVGTDSVSTRGSVSGSTGPSATHSSVNSAAPRRQRGRPPQDKRAAPPPRSRRVLQQDTTVGATGTAGPHVAPAVTAPPGAPHESHAPAAPAAHLAVSAAARMRTSSAHTARSGSVRSMRSTYLRDDLDALDASAEAMSMRLYPQPVLLDDGVPAELRLASDADGSMWSAPRGSVVMSMGLDAVSVGLLVDPLVPGSARPETGRVV